MAENKDIDEENVDVTDQMQKDTDAHIEREPDPQNEDNRSIGEKIEDGMDEVVAGVQDFFYGERKNFNEDIPATMVDPDSEIRHVNKVQTRRNFNKKYGAKFIKWLFIILGIGLVVSLGYGLIEKLLMA